MMTQIQKNDFPDLASLSTADLKNELARGLEITARHLRHLAQIWRELESRGEDLSDIKHGLMAYLPMIANNTVDPSIIVNYAGQKTLLAALSTLPVETQRQIADTGMITVAAADGSEVETPVSRLRASEIGKIFDVQSGKIRSIPEQMKFIEATHVKKIKHHVTSIIHFEKQDDVDLLVISGKRVKISRVLNAIADKYPDISAELKKLVSHFK